jgi:hypothetical protein
MLLKQPFVSIKFKLLMHFYFNEFQLKYFKLLKGNEWLKTNRHLKFVINQHHR